MYYFNILWINNNNNNNNYNHNNINNFIKLIQNYVTKI